VERVTGSRRHDRRNDQKQFLETGNYSGTSAAPVTLAALFGLKAELPMPMVGPMLKAPHISLGPAVLKRLIPGHGNPTRS
jgi:hypothetical protein